MKVIVDLPEAQPHDTTAELVRGLIQGIAQGAVNEFRRLGLPGLYESGIRFAEDPAHGSGDEPFELPWQTLVAGDGDCNQLVIYRICELLARGRKATCRALWLGPDLHVQVVHGNPGTGAIEDPSIELGAPVDWPEFLLFPKNRKRFRIEK